MVSNTDNLCTKQGNSLIFETKIRGLLSRAGYNGLRMVHKPQEQKTFFRIKFLLKMVNFYNPIFNTWVITGKNIQYFLKITLNFRSMCACKVPH